MNRAIKGGEKNQAENKQTKLEMEKTNCQTKPVLKGYKKS